jgi:hypothetical protein
MLLLWSQLWSQLLSQLWSQLLCQLLSLQAVVRHARTIWFAHHMQRYFSKQPQRVLDHV